MTEPRTGGAGGGGATRLLSGAAVVVVAGFATQGAMLVGSVLSARVLGVEQRGSLGLFTTVPVVAAQVALAGLPVGVVYALARHRETGRQVLAALGRYLPVPAVLAAVAAGGVVPILDRSLATPVTVALAALLAIGVVWQAIGVACLEGIQAYRSLSLQRLLPALAFSLVVAALVIAEGATLPAVCAAYAAAWCVSALVTWRVAYERLPASPSGAAGPSGAAEREPTSVRPMLSFGARSLGHYLSPIETFRADVIGVGMFLGPYALGLYIAGTTFTVLPRLVAQSLGAVAQPAIARAPTRAAAGRLTAAFVLGGVGSVAVIAALIVQLAPAVVVVLLGEPFLPAVPAVRTLQLAAVMMGFRAMLVVAARGLGRPGADGVAELVSLPVLAAGLVAGFASGDPALVGLAVALAYGTGSAVVASVVVRVLRTPEEASKASVPRVPVGDGTAGESEP